jgi:hypothetical protein
MGIRKNFISRKGLEISDNLIFAEDNRVGIKTVSPSHTLTVNGDVGVNEITVSDKIYLDGEVEIDGSSGVIGQYLVSTGNGVSWQNVPGLRTLSTVIAEPNQTIFNVSYTPSSGVDVFVNGARLSPSDYIATNGTTIEFIVPCFGDENIDFISYSVFGSSAPGISIQNNSTSVGDNLAINSIDFVGFKDVQLNQSGVGVTVYNSTDNVQYSGIVTALGGFISVGNTTPVKISVAGNQLIFTVTGIGSTSFTLA